MPASSSWFARARTHTNRKTHSVFIFRRRWINFWLRLIRTYAHSETRETQKMGAIIINNNNMGKKLEEQHERKLEEHKKKLEEKHTTKIESKTLTLPNHMQPKTLWCCACVRFNRVTTLRIFGSHRISRGSQTLIWRTIELFSLSCESHLDLVCLPRVDVLWNWIWSFPALLEIKPLSLHPVHTKWQWCNLNTHILARNIKVDHGHEGGT